ncbi:MAG: NtaA/DmoA family FMN-dependent monooxygenase [Microbacteriaceae bacterium]
MTKQIRMNLIFHTAGRHDAAWKSFEDSAKLIADVDHQIEMAKMAEAAKFDAIFLPDTPGSLRGNFLRRPRRGLDPVVLLAAIARETKHLGLISTSPTLQAHPFFAARALATLHQVSNGRAGWNIVTSQDDETREALGITEILERDARYEKAEEFVKIVTGLWDSLPQDAIVGDVENDIYVDYDQTHPIDFKGEYYQSAGVLPMPGRYDGERPVIFQAGVSQQSREFGARWADALFTSQPTPDHDRKFYSEAKAHAASIGRNPDDLVVLPGLYTVVADTEAEARKRKLHFDEMLDMGFLLKQLSNQIEVPLESLDPLKELPYDLLDAPSAQEVIEYRRKEMVPVAKANKWTVKDLVFHNLTRGQRTLIGTPEQVADGIIEWIDSGVGDGFNVNADVQPEGLLRFTDVITELQDRGRFRKEYEFDSFRENFGLSRS